MDDSNFRGYLLDDGDSSARLVYVLPSQAMNLDGFVSKWKPSKLTERSASHEHFLDLCSLLDVPTPASIDSIGDMYTFEKGASKTSGGDGWADVWYSDHFAWEYKGKHANLPAAYRQLLNYREDLGNPPLLVVCDFERFEIHTNFTRTVKKVYAFTLDDLVGGEPISGSVYSPLEILRLIFHDPDRLKPDQTAARVTETAALEFAKLAENIRSRGVEPHLAARFLIRVLFCLFAEDIGLLPDDLLTKLLDNVRRKPNALPGRLSELFAAMAHGGWFGVEDIRHFNGGLFTDDSSLPLTREDIAILIRAAKMDWSSVEPSIFGTLFERSLDPNSRAKQGAHYTSAEDILDVVEPVLMEPLRREWRAVQDQADVVSAKRDAAPNGKRQQLDSDLQLLLRGFKERLAAIRVLDPACGSGNFLYVALRQLLDLEKEVSRFELLHGLVAAFPLVGPEQMHGLEINEYAQELAPISVAIGYIQWLRDNGFGLPGEPILRESEAVISMDSLLRREPDGGLSKPNWPEADVIIGNPPFLGGKLLRLQLGDAYVEGLFRVYEGEVARESDLVCYFFERARQMIEQGKAKRAGLLATNSIRGGANRTVLEAIKRSGDIFTAWSDRPWILDGASVRISIVGFDGGAETSHSLDGRPVTQINADLTGSYDLTGIVALRENAGISFMGDTKGGPFDIDEDTAKRMLAAPLNPNGRPNSDVIRPWINALDITRRPRKMYIIDFGVDMPESAAAFYEQPFEYVKKHVLPKRKKSRTTRSEWWLHERPRIDMRIATAGPSRFIVTPRVSRHRLFVWRENPTLLDSATFVFARSDDYFFGVLHSRVHESWSLATCTWLGVGNDPRYTPDTTFLTFPFPWPPGKEPQDDPIAREIAAAAAELTRQRDAWLNPPEADESELKNRTLTNLYNQQPSWLQTAHGRLDQAVCRAYGWPETISDAQILENLAELNRVRSAG